MTIVPSSSRPVIYLALGLVLSLVFALLRESTWQGSVALHTVMESLATMLALVVGLMALVRHYSKKDSIFLIIGAGFLGTGFLDGYHALVTSAWLRPMMPSDLPALIPWSWVASRQFLSIMLVLSWLAWWREQRLREAGKFSEQSVFVFTGIFTIGSFLFFAFAPLPRAYYSEYLFHRPEEFAPALFFAVALAGYLLKGQWRHDVFEHWLVLSLIVGLFGQAVFMSSSGTLFDFEFDISHTLKKASYICVLTGLMLGMYATFRREAMVARELDFQKQAVDEHAIVSITDARGNITYVNDKFCQISGYVPEELIGKNHRLLKSDEHSAEFYKDMWQTISSGEPWAGEVKNLRKDGTSYWVKASIVPFLNEKGEPLQYISIRTDINEHKMIEENLKRSEEKYSNSINSTTEGYWLVDIEGRMLEVNNAFCEMLDRHESELLGKRPPEFADPASREIHEKNTSDIETSEQRRYEVTFIDKSGRSVHTNVSATTIRDADGKATGAFAFITDMSEHKLFERRLQESEEKFRRFYELVPEMFTIIDLDSGIFVDANEGFCRLTGYSRDEVVGKASQDLRIWDDQDARNVLISRLAVEGTVDGFEAIFRHKNGSTWPGVISISLFEMNDKQYALASTRDVSEIRRSREEAIKANQAKSEFLSSMSHELRTPLNSILGFGHLLESDPEEPLSDEQNDSLAHIVRSGQHLLALVNDVLDLAGIESGKIEMSIINVSPIEVIEESKSYVATMAEGRGIEISVSEAALASSPVRADQTRLRQILVNLLSNAVKYNRPGGKVIIDAREMPGRMLRIVVQDTGEGIPPDRQGELFKAFSRLGAESSDIEGTGIGLVVCKNLVEHMEGSIGMESEVGKGSGFWIDLPRAEGGSDEANDVMDGVAVPTRTGEDDLSATLLYVEDNAANLKLMQKVVARIPGLSMIPATTGESGLELAMTEVPDVIILDINLPGMNGLEVLKHLGDAPATRNIPVLALSAAASSQDINKGLESGFSRYLTKPVNIPEVVDAVRTALTGG